ncbi:MAG TPA: hypothetical protein VFS67_09500 [Polyangiaceae bacterium]|nr:hypothetical protein [Polyangiaceae bacterium]
MTESAPEPAYRPASWLDGPCAWLAWVLPLGFGVWSAGGAPRWQDDLAIVRGLGLVPAGSEGVVSSVLSQLFSLLPVGSRALRADLVGVVALAACSAVSFSLLCGLLDQRRAFGLNPLLALLGSQLWALSAESLGDAAAPGSGAVALLGLLLGARLVRSSSARSDARVFSVAGGLLGITFGESHAAALWLLAVLLGDWLFGGDDTELPWLRFAACFALGAGSCALVPWLRSASGHAWIDLGLRSLPVDAAPESSAWLGWAASARAELARIGALPALFALAGALIGFGDRGLRRSLAPWAILIAGSVLGPLLQRDSAPLCALAASAGLAAFVPIGLQAALAWLWSCQLPFAQPATVLGVSFAVTLVLQRVEAPGAPPQRELATEAWTDEALGRLPEHSVLLVESPALALRALSAQLQGARPDLTVLPLPLLHRGSVSSRLLRRAPALAPVLRQLAVNGAPDEYSFGRLADARPLFVQLDARWDARLFDHLCPDGLWLRFAARPLSKSERQLGADRAREALQRLLEPEAPVWFDARTRAVLAQQVGQQALALAALGELEPAQRVLRSLHDLSPEDALGQALAERLERGKGRVAINELLQ